MSHAASSGKPGNKPTPAEPSATSTTPGFLERLAGLLLHFDRFGWDVAGVALLALALLTLIGLVDATQGAFIRIWMGFLSSWFGWGKFLAPVIIAALGLLVLRKPAGKPAALPLGRVLAFEGAFFALLALLALSGGQSLARASAGQDGGQVGWGLAEIAARILGTFGALLLAGLLLIYFLMTALGLFPLIARRIRGWLNLQPPPAAAVDAPDTATGQTSPPAAEPPQRSAAAARPVKLNPSAAAGQSYPRNDRLPPLNLLGQQQVERPDEHMIHTTAAQLEKTLGEFGIPARVTGYRVGPTVTQYAVEPGFVEKAGVDGEVQRQKVRVAQISALARDLALALSAERLRIEAPVPGRSYVGIEVPNPNSTVVRLRPLIDSEAFHKLHSPLALALGQDVSGLPVAADLGRMPHVLIAGTTGSGKSVCIAALTACLVMNNTPEDLRLAMLDPKMVELVRFNGLPHLLGKVETELERMLGVLRWALAEMDQRYRLLEDARVRDLQAYNQKMERRKQPTLPRIVLLIDELADLMMSSPDQTEHSLVRLAQMARATGIHLVVATQRPSTDVVTGLIKANFPARISFTVASSVDSRVILDMNGAETLLGRGDMLFINPEVGTPQRAQGVLVTDAEIDKIINFWQKMAPKTEEAGGEAAPWEELLNQENGEEGGDSLVEQAVEIVRKTQRASASMLQRRLRIGYPRAARLIDELEELGVVGPSQGGGREREVLLAPNEDDELESDEEEV